MTAAFDYTRTRATAERLLARFGASAAIQRTTTTGPAWDPVQTVTTYACTAVVIDYEARSIDGTLIRQTDKRALVSTRGLTIEPTVTDKLIADGVNYTIVNVKPLKPAATVVLYELQCRV